MTAQLAITLKDDQKARLDALAEARHETVADVVAEAVSQYLEYDDWFAAEVEEGLADIRAGRVYSLDEVAAEFRQKIADLPKE